MALLTAAPTRPELVGLVAAVWAGERGPAPTPAERSMPTGAVHIALRLRGGDLRIDGASFSRAVVGGPRTAAYRRETLGPVTSVGVMIEPWAVAAIVGAPGEALRGRHVDLEALWGRAAALRLLARLDDALAGGPRALVARVEAELAGRLGDARPTGADRLAVEASRRGHPQAEVAAALGWSPRRLRARVRALSGLSPREHHRLTRLQRLLRRVAERPEEAWIDRALAAGYADQAHLCREFRALTGLTPTAYAPLPGQPNHVPEREVGAPPNRSRRGAGRRR
ncbi:MAG: helix-turn-helix domain-containing protein [Nannocystaceae bacterium]